MILPVNKFSVIARELYHSIIFKWNFSSIFGLTIIVNKKSVCALLWVRPILLAHLCISFFRIYLTSSCSFSVSKSDIFSLSSKFYSPENWSPCLFSSLLHSFLRFQQNSWIASLSALLQDIFPWLPLIWKIVKQVGNVFTANTHANQVIGDTGVQFFPFGLVENKSLMLDE